MGEDLRGDAVLQRRDDVAAVRVVLGVRREDHQDVERNPDGEAADLEVALLEDVQEADLDARLQVGQLVDREDPPVRPRDDPVVDDLLVGERVDGLGDPLQPEQIHQRGVGPRENLDRHRIDEVGEV